MGGRIKQGIRVIAAMAFIFVMGFLFGWYQRPLPPPTASDSTAQPVPAEKPRRAHSQLYIDNHLGFQMEVPKEWVNRYGPIQSGVSVGFAFEKASSPPGTPKMDLAQVFTITRYPSAQFDETVCGCKELGRGKGVVFGYKFDGQTVPLASPLTIAGIQAALQNDIPAYFQPIE